MFCNKCGTEIKGEDKFCQNCGTASNGTFSATSEEVMKTERLIGWRHKKYALVFFLLIILLFWLINALGPLWIIAIILLLILFVLAGRTH